MNCERLSFGVDLVEGLPGAGKSYWMVREVVRVVVDELRPVYTNLPLKWRAVDAYARAKGGPRCANLIHQLDESHFARFIERVRQRQAFLDARRDWRRELSRDARSASLEGEWLAMAGPDVIVGPSANWIPTGAVVLIDECQHWFSQAKQKDETPALQSYVTMHRHFLHRIVVASQERMQISITFRRLMSRLIAVRSKGEDRIAWGIQFKHLGIRGIGVAVYGGDQLAGKTTETAAPYENFVILTGFPWNQVIFRLYSSFTHSAGVKLLRRDLARVRASAGVLVEAPVSVPEEVGFMGRAAAAVRSFAWRWTRRAFMCGAVGAVSFMSGMGYQRLRALGSLTSKEQASVTEGDKPIVWPSLEGLGNGFARIGGKRVGVGEKGDGFTLQAVSPRQRTIAVVRGDDLFVWKLGDAEPQRVGPVGAVAAELAAARRAAGAGGRGGGSGEGAPSAVGVSSGDDSGVPTARGDRGG